MLLQLLNTNQVCLLRVSVADDDGDDRVFKNVKIIVLLKYLSNFFRSLEMPPINCKIHLELNWSRDCVMSNLRNNSSNKKRKTVCSNCYLIKLKIT